MALLIGAGFFAVLILIAIFMPSQPEPPTRTHRGLEMKARNGRLIHIRETESEREI